MKRIKITSDENILRVPYGSHMGQYSVMLDWGKQYYFPSHKKAARFVAIANQFYTQSMYEANSIYIDVWVKYRRDWCYLEGMDNEKCKNHLRSCQESFDLMYERSDYVQLIVVNKLKVILDRLQSTILILKEINSNSSGTFELYALDVLSKRTFQLEHSIKVFGDYEAQHLNKRPIHETTIQPSTLMANVKMSVAG